MNDARNVPNPHDRSKSNRKDAGPTLHARRRDRLRPTEASWRQSLYDIIFEADSPAGKAFDIGLLIAILASVAIVSLETLEGYKHLQFLYVSEWLLTVFFSIEYLLRLICVRQPLRYVFSFWGIIDLLSFLPSYLTFFYGGSSRSFVILRSIRLLRIFRVLKLWRMMNEADELAAAVWHARGKIIVFLATVLVAVTIAGTLMYYIETVTLDGIDETSDFTSIPQSMYWAIVTMTTVGYGDVVPHTSAGKVISAILILLGYSLIIVPSTFVSAEIVQAQTSGLARSGEITQPCENCGMTTHPAAARFCHRCGTPLA